MGKIEVEGYAKRTVDYDLMEITIGFNEFEKTAEKSSKKVMEDCEKFLGELKRSGMDISAIRLDEDKVRSTSRYFSGKEQEGYGASRRLELTTSFDMKVINGLRNLANKMNLPASFDVQYRLSNATDIREELRLEALKNAKAQAELIAQTIDMKVKGLLSVNKREFKDMECESLMCLAEGEIDDLFECESAYEYSDELQSTTITLSENIYTKWEVEYIDEE